MLTPHASATPPEPRPVPGAVPAGELPPEVAAFLERLRRLPLGAWADAGRLLEELDARPAAAGPLADVAAHGAEVRAELRQVVNAMPREARQIRSRVLHLATVAHGFVHPSDVARMKKAALVAALALVARPALGPARFGRAYAPFATSIPADSLLAAAAAAAAAEAARDPEVHDPPEARD